MLRGRRWIHLLQYNVVLCRLVVSHVDVACLQVAFQRLESSIVICGPAVYPDAYVEGFGRRHEFDFSLDYVPSLDMRSTYESKSTLCTN